MIDESRSFKLIIRNETTADHEAISQVTLAAFQVPAISHHPEPYIINACVRPVLFRQALKPAINSPPINLF